MRHHPDRVGETRDDSVIQDHCGDSAGISPHRPADEPDHGSIPPTPPVPPTVAPPRVGAAWTRTTWGRVFLMTSGILLILAGFLMGFVPFLPGFPLGILGIMLLSLASRRVRALLKRGADHLPHRLRKRLHFLDRTD